MTSSPASSTRLTDVGQADVALIDDVTLAQLIAAKLVEPIDRSLVANRKLLLPPFDSPSYDQRRPPQRAQGLRHCRLRRLDVRRRRRRRRPGCGFFDLAATLPGRVAVPPDPDVVIGAALTAAGHDWNSSSSSDMADAADILLPLRQDSSSPDRCCAAACRRRSSRRSVTARGSPTPPAGVRFVVPPEGTLARVRCYCIPLYAPHPVSAHAWLNHTLDPAVAAAETRYTRRATPVGPAVFQLPVSLLANEAVFPPALPPTPLTFASVSTSGAAAARRPLARADRHAPAPARATVDCSRRSGSRDALGRRGKSGHRRARVPGNARTGKPDGKRNREQTADRRPSRASRQG